MKRTLLTLLILGAVPVGIVHAEDPDDGPGRGVARISVINGDVSVRRGDSGDLVAAAINAPLVVGDQILVGPTSRAEVQFDYADMIRLDGNSEVRFSELEYRRYQMQIARGTVTFRVLRDSDAQVELSTPSVSVRPVKQGIYRVTVKDDGSSEITVRSGEAEIFTPRGVERLQSGKTMLARGSASEPEFRIVAAIPEDSWDRWNEDRDRSLERSRAYQYVSRDIYGAEDLDGYGRWVWIPTYGWCWSPVVAAGWAPYRFGRWGWTDWYGWTWISYDPWGWAPYHYGRWFHHGPYGWCWYPGSIYGRHYWRPALVAFFGWNSYSGFHAGVGIGFGRVGWVPLAPFETFHPWYGRRYYGGFRGGARIDNSVNIVNNVNVTNIYRNARVANGITAIDGGSFGRGRVSNPIRISQTDMRRASLVRGQLPVAPGRESLRLADRQVRTSGANGASFNRQFYSRQTPRQPERIPFEQQQRGMEQIARRTFNQAPQQPGRVSGRSASVTRAGDRTAARTATEAGRGWRTVGQSDRGTAAHTAPEGSRRFGEPAGSNQSRVLNTGPGNRSAETRLERSGGTASGGWRAFGEPTRVSPTRPEQTQRQARPSGQAGQPSDGWQRFGEPARIGPSRSQRTEQGSRSSGRIGASTEGWQRFETSPAPSTRESRPGFSDRTPATRGAQRDERFSTQGSRSPNSIRISPPIVRERSSPRSEGRFGGSVSRDSGSFGRAPQGRISGADRGGSMRSGSASRSSGRISGRSSQPSVRSGGGSSRSGRSQGRGGRSR
jgi:hypothetical protein